jgi:cytochrome b
MTQTTNNYVNVWDIRVRLFHWLLVAGCITEYFTGHWRWGGVHMLVGYALCLLLLVRVYGGFTGSQYARFKSFIFSPGETINYIRSMFTGHPKHYYGHNPAGALMVFALLALLLAIFITGLLTLGMIDYQGPFAAFANRVDDETSYAIRHLHHRLVNVGLLLVLLHLLGVLAGSLQHKENLVRAMVTGRKIKPSHSA